MILSQPDIRRAVEAGEIEFSPELDEKQWGEASIDLRLGFKFTRYKKDHPAVTISVAEGLKGINDIGLWDDKTLSEFDSLGDRETYELRPGEFVLALTYESIKIPNNLRGHVEGRSTYARLGLSMHQTAPWIQPGWSGPIVLEIANHGSYTIKLTPLIDRPCQLTFFELKTPVPDALAYGSRSSDTFQNQEHPLDQRPKRTR
jgi:dCTP deaminase